MNLVLMNEATKYAGLPRNGLKIMLDPVKDTKHSSLNPINACSNSVIQNGSTLTADTHDINFLATAYEMNTPSDTDNYLFVPKSPTYDNLDEMTFIIPCKAVSAGGGSFGRLFDKANGSAVTGVLGYIDANRRVTIARYNGISNYKQWASPPIPAFGTNNIIVIKIKRALIDSAVNVLVNGAQQTLTVSQSGTPAIVDDSGNDLYFGNRLGTDRYFNGLFNLLMMYDRILTSTESFMTFARLKSLLNTREIN